MGLLMDQQQAQKIFNILIEALKDANDCNIDYVCKGITRIEHKDPIADYLSSVRDKLTDNGFNENNDDFLTKVYNNAFYTGKIPKNRNHIRITTALTVENNYTSNILIYWIDLDKVAQLTKKHLSPDSSYRFEFKGGAENGWDVDAYSRDGICSPSVRRDISSVVNSYYTPNDTYSNFLILRILAGTVLLIASFALISGVPLIFPLGVMVLAAAVIFYGLLYCDAPLYTKPIPSDSQALNSIDLVKTFEEHFKDPIYKTPSDNHGNDHDGEVEIIPESEDETSTNSSGASNS